jgi:flagellar biosynthesis component FlhA
VGWVITRHGFFNILIYSVYYDMPRFNLIQWDPSRHYFHTYGIYISYLCLLCGLEILCIYWFYLVIGIVRRVISGRKPEDTRSDSEDSDNEESTTKSKKNKKHVTDTTNTNTNTATATAVEAQEIASVQTIEETTTPRRSQRRH